MTNALKPLLPACHVPRSSTSSTHPAGAAVATPSKHPSPSPTSFHHHHLAHGQRPQEHSPALTTHQATRRGCGACDGGRLSCRHVPAASGVTHECIQQGAGRCQAGNRPRLGVAMINDITNKVLTNNILPNSRTLDGYPLRQNW